MLPLPLGPLGEGAHRVPGNYLTITGVPRRSDGVPGEYVGRALERGKRGSERTLELRLDLVGSPAVEATDRAHRPRLAEQEDLVVAHTEDLARDALGAVRGEIDRERRDLLRRHLLEALN